MSIHTELYSLLKTLQPFENINNIKELFKSKNYYFSQVDFDDANEWYYLFNLQKENITFSIALYCTKEENVFKINDFNITEI